MKIAFIGFRHGHIFSLYRKCAEHPDVEICGAWEDGDAARADCAKEGIELIKGGYEALIEDKEIDAIAIGYYFGGRGKIAIDALKAGKHIIADKPLCTSLDELNEIERLANEKNLKVGLMLDLRYMGVTPIAKKLIDEGKIGKIHAVNFGGQHCLGYGTRPTWYFEEGKHGGTINDIAIHGLDLIMYLTGKQLSKIRAAHCWNAFADKEPHFKDAGQLMIELEDEIGVIGDATYATPRGVGPIPQYWRTTIWGSKGLIEFSVTTNKLWAAFEDVKGPQIFEAEDNKESDYLTDFLADVNATPTAFDTKRNIASTKSLLEIQAFADADGKD